MANIRENINNEGEEKKDIYSRIRVINFESEFTSPVNLDECPVLEETNKKKDIFGKRVEGIFSSSGEFLDNKDIIKMDCDAQWLKIKERINANIGHLSEGILLPFEKIYLENGQRLELANFSLSVDSSLKCIRVKLIRISENNINSENKDI